MITQRVSSLTTWWSRTHRKFRLNFLWNRRVIFFKFSFGFLKVNLYRLSCLCGYRVTVCDCKFPGVVFSQRTYRLVYDTHGQLFGWDGCVSKVMEKGENEVYLKVNFTCMVFRVFRLYVKLPYCVSLVWTYWSRGRAPWLVIVVGSSGGHEGRSVIVDGMGISLGYRTEDFSAQSKRTKSWKLSSDVTHEKTQTEENKL